MKFQISSLLTVILGLAFGHSFQCTTALAQQPNVLFIAVDDLNDWIGCMEGHPQALTPNMDRLAERGVLFMNAHCAAPACNPSRAAVFSGRMPDITGVWSNNSGSLQRVFSQAKTLPVAFSKSGYRTLGTGKLLHSKSQSNFDDYFSTNQRWSPLPKDKVRYTKAELKSKSTNNPIHVTQDSQGHTITLPLNRMPSDRRPNRADGESFDWGEFDVPDDDFGDTKITDWAIDKLKEKSEKPLFLAVGYYRPHIPLWAPKRFFERFKNDPGQIPNIRTNDLDDLNTTAKKWATEAVTAGSHATVLKHQQWQSAVEAYLACITYVDHEIGRLLQVLDDSEIGDNTIIVLWSDHGWHLGEKQHWGKWTGWERSTRVPMIIVPPKNLRAQFAAAGSKCDQPVGLIDLYPTLMDLCSVESPTPLDGESLVPLLKNPAKKTNRTITTLFDPANVSLRNNRWRFIRYADGSEELYDLKNDPSEWTNQIGNSDTDKIAQDFRNQIKTVSLDPSQAEWHAKYKKQQNAPAPETMLLNGDSEPKPKDGFVSLFNGKNLNGWTPQGGACKFEAVDGCIVGTCVPKTDSTYLCTDRHDFQDFIFSCEMKWEVDGNSGVMFHAGTKPAKNGSVTVFGPQAEMEGFSKLDRGWSGGIYGQSCGGFFYPLWLKEHQRARTALRPDKWNRLTISASGNHIKTWVNGIPCAHWIDDGTYADGFFGLQIHKGQQGQVRWKNLLIKEVK